MLIQDRLGGYVKPKDKIDARANVQRFWFQLFETQQGTVFENLTESTQSLMMFIYQELTVFDKTIRSDLKKTFNTDRSRYWKEYTKQHPEARHRKRIRTAEMRKRQLLKSLTDKLENNVDIISVQNTQIEKQKKTIQNKKEEVKRIEEKEISYIAQRGFLQEFEKSNFYHVCVDSIKNQLVFVSNFYANFFKGKENNETKTLEEIKEPDRKFLLGLMERHSDLLASIGIDKLMQLQPQALSVILQNQNNANFFNGSEFATLQDELEENRK